MGQLQGQFNRHDVFETIKEVNSYYSCNKETIDCNQIRLNNNNLNTAIDKVLEI